MRRELLASLVPQGGYVDSANQLAGGQGYGEGSCNQLILGDDPVPFQGYTSKGGATGSALMSPLASTWGGIKIQSSASGSLVEDYSKTLYMIGAGYPSKEGVTLQAYASTPTTIVIDPATDVNTGTDTFTENAHGLATGSQLRYTDDGAVAIGGLTQDTTYFVINVGANTFKLATSWVNAQAGTAIDITSTGTGNQTFTKGVDMTLSTQLKVATSQLSDYLYRYFDTAGLARPDAPTLEVPTAVGSNYTGLIDGAISFKVAAIRDRQSAGTNLTSPIADVRSIASTTSAVVVPQRRSVKITFPTAVTGQTHWAVFATKVGFGGTGVHYRVGYRTSTAESATWIFGIPEETVAAASTRTLEFDFRDGDLLPEEAWLFDYVPPQGTHFLRMENVGVVLGCYDGTVGAVSLPNFFESYHPRHLLYFPEAITACLHRQIDNFAYVACRNSIHVLQYVGYRGDDYPSCTVSTISPEVGIAHPQNWAAGGGMICAFIEGSGLALITKDGIDMTFGKEIRRFVSSWTAASTVVGYDPKSKSFVIGNGAVSISICLENGFASTPVYAVDFSVSGNWQSAINSRGELVASFNNGGTYTAHSYNYDVTSPRSPVAFISRWQNARGRSANIYEVQASVRNGTNTEAVILGVHANLFKTFVRGCSTTSGSANLTVPSGTFTSSVTGKQAVITGTNVGGVGTHYLVVRLTYVNATTASMANRSTGSAVNAQATLSNVFIIVGEDFETITPAVSTDQHFYSFYPNIQDARSYAVSVYQPTDGSTGGVIEANVFGTPQRTSEAKL